MPFAFLGSGYDDKLEQLYTTMSTKDVAVMKGFLKGLFSDAMADTTPLRALIESSVSADIIDAIAEQHRRDYTKPQLGQEREVIAITALMRMGMPTSAQKRAEQFKRTYPRSAYLGQIERIVDR